jgi:hypothetical protein
MESKKPAALDLLDEMLSHVEPQRKTTISIRCHDKSGICCLCKAKLAVNQFVDYGKFCRKYHIDGYCVAHRHCHLQFANGGTNK